MYRNAPKKRPAPDIACHQDLFKINEKVRRLLLALSGTYGQTRKIPARALSTPALPDWITGIVAMSSSTRSRRVRIRLSSSRGLCPERTVTPFNELEGMQA